MTQLFISLLVLASSFKLPFSYSPENRACFDGNMNRDSLPLVYSEVLNLAFESCGYTHPDFCFDGCHQILTLSPRFVLWDSLFGLDNLENRYKLKVFVFSNEEFNRVAGERNPISMFNYDSLFANIQTTKIKIRACLKFY
jgi:hypothetical protein